MYEQLEGRVPDFIAVPTSACGHIRGIFKGYRELKEAGLTDRLPRMIVVQAANVNPIVSAIREGRDRIVPVTGKETVAEAITSGDPPGETRSSGRPGSSAGLPRTSRKRKSSIPSAGSPAPGISSSRRRPRRLRPSES
jgi:hypothetical protein